MHVLSEAVANGESCGGAFGAALNTWASEGLGTLRL